MRDLIPVLVAGMLLLAAPPAAAAVWQVPDSVGTVGEAVALAAPGDTVLVACGVYPEHDIVLTDAIVIRSATGDPDCVTIDAGGAGRVFVSDDPDGEARLEGLTVTGGSAPGATALTGWGGGMLFIGAPPTLVDCRITGNSASAGGGLALGGHGVPSLVRCELSDNTALYGGGLLGQVVTVSAEGCVFSGNAADSSGGALYASLSDLAFAGCTFHGNSAGLEGAALRLDLESVCTVDNTILSFSAEGEAAWCDPTSTVTASCTDVFGNAGGDWSGALAGQGGTDGNFSADPLFCDAAAGDLGLRADSPCLPGRHPAGDPCGLIGARGQACGVIGVPEDPPARAAARLRLSPNPFRSSLRLAYDLTAPERAVIEVFDVAGRLFRRFEIGTIDGEFFWDGTDQNGYVAATGLYFVRLRTASGTETHRILFLR